MPHRNLGICCVHLPMFEEQQFQALVPRLSGDLQNISRIELVDYADNGNSRTQPRIANVIHEREESPEQGTTWIAVGRQRKPLGE